MHVRARQGLAGAIVHLVAHTSSFPPRTGAGESAGDHSSHREAHMTTAITRKRPAGLLARFGSAFRAMFPPPSDRPDEPPRAPVPTGAPGNQRHQDATAVLTAARGVVRRGWGQNTWSIMKSPAGHRRAFQPIFPRRLDHTQVVQACL